MKKICMLLALLAATAWGGSVDTDGYYVMDGLELMAFNGATADTATMEVSSPFFTVSGIAAASNSWWLQFWGDNALGVLPTDLQGAIGWKLTFTNTSEAGGINVVLVAGSAGGDWQQGEGFWADPGETVTAYLDIAGTDAMTNFWIVLSIPADHDVLTFEVPGAQNYLLPYDPDASDQAFNAIDPTKVDITLRWKAAMDPNTLSGVNPDIVDQYVFISTPTDPNLYYLGATGADPLANPDSSYGPFQLPIATSYTWAVVEAIEGNTQTLTPGVSTLTDVDPNNLVGYKWHFNTKSALPEIKAQPTSTRFGVNDTGAAFTVTAESPTPITYQWFYSKDGAIDAGDNPINATLGGNTKTLTITAHNKAYQAYYYCRLSNMATETGGGLAPDVYTDVVTLVVERKVAEYLFDGNLNDTSGSGVNGTGVGNPGFATGIGGVANSALSLDGASQYVDFTDAADPNNNNLAFPHADLLEAGAGGIGGGLDRGTVTCWVKLDTAPATVAPILSNRNEGWPTTWFQFAIESVGASTNLQTFIWGSGSTSAVFWGSWRPTWVDPFSVAGDGQWHLMAATWDMDGTMKAYVDGSLIAVSGAGTPTTFGAWVNGMLIGADYDGNHFDGLLDNLRVYNYEVPAEAIAQEYHDVTGGSGCIYWDFTGSVFNVDNTGASYCRVDLADVAVLAQNWLNDGFYPVQ